MQKHIIMGLIAIVICLALSFTFFLDQIHTSEMVTGKTIEIQYNLRFTISSVNVFNNTVTGCVSTPPGTEFNWSENDLYAKLITKGTKNYTEKVKMVVNIGGTDYVVDRQNNEICK